MESIKGSTDAPETGATWFWRDVPKLCEQHEQHVQKWLEGQAEHSTVHRISFSEISGETELFR